MLSFRHLKLVSSLTQELHLQLIEILHIYFDHKAHAFCRQLAVS